MSGTSSRVLQHGMHSGKPRAQGSPVPKGPGMLAMAALSPVKQLLGHGKQPGAKQTAAWKSAHEQFTGGAPGCSADLLRTSPACAITSCMIGALSAVGSHRKWRTVHSDKPAQCSSHLIRCQLGSRILHGVVQGGHDPVAPSYGDLQVPVFVLLCHVGMGR